MGEYGILLWILIGLAVVCIFLCGVLLIRLAAMERRSLSGAGTQFEKLRRDLAQENRESRQETAQSLQASLKSLGDALAQVQQQTGMAQDKRLFELNQQLSLRLNELMAQLSTSQQALQTNVSDMTKKLDDRMGQFSLQSDRKLEGIRATVQDRLTVMQTENAQKLDQMRATVDEKLQKTLETRITESFKVVSERLEQVYKGLGEMQTLAAGVGDLKKVLSNVKTRGIMGEIQLGAILEEMLSPEQYEKNLQVRPGSTSAVEYAVKLPGEGGDPVYLPIDAKFPADAYAQLQDAYDTGRQEIIEAAAATLRHRVIQSARDIRDKYVLPPKTTDFAVMFLPFEGLYAEVVRRGMIEELQRDYKISVAGPSTMAALLNSLQMGFKTLAIQKRSSEVWAVLSGVKTEFNKFNEVLRSAQKRLDQANNDLETLVGTRSRQIQKRLHDITDMPAVALETSPLPDDEEPGLTPDSED